MFKFSFVSDRITFNGIILRIQRSYVLEEILPAWCVPLHSSALHPGVCQLPGFRERLRLEGEPERGHSPDGEWHCIRQELISKSKWLVSVMCVCQRPLLVIILPLFLSSSLDIQLVIFWTRYEYENNVYYWILINQHFIGFTMHMGSCMTLHVHYLGQ